VARGAAAQAVVNDGSTVAEVLRRRLRELKRTSRELAEAVEVPPEYIDELIAGSRRAPLPGRTDLYERMTAFLRLGRNDLTNCARAERAAAVTGHRPGPQADVRRILLELCEPATARQLEKRRTRAAVQELTSLLERLLGVTQGAVRRVLDDQIGLRLSATQSGRSYEAMRLRVLDFLDATPDTVTMEQLNEFILPRIGRWDVDMKTGVLRVVLRAQEPRERSRRSSGRSAGARPSGAPRRAPGDD
jgi:hypothetical protein